MAPEGFKIQGEGGGWKEGWETLKFMQKSLQTDRPHPLSTPGQRMHRRPGWSLLSDVGVQKDSMKNVSKPVRRMPKTTTF